MNDLKPVAEVAEDASFFGNGDIYLRLLSDEDPPIGTKLYAIPPAHRVVSVELLKRIAADVSPFSHYALKEELRAIIDNKEQP